MPLSFFGFGFPTILLMVAVLAAVEGVKYLKGRFHGVKKH
jgi:hypothetical protein